MACHPNDSPTPPEGYQGVHAVLSTVEGLKKFVSIKESPYHGFNFCVGTVSEMLMDREEPTTWSVASAHARKSSTCTSATFWATGSLLRGGDRRRFLQRRQSGGHAQGRGL